MVIRYPERSFTYRLYSALCQIITLSTNKCQTKTYCVAFIVPRLLLDEEFSRNFCAREECRVVSMTGPHDRQSRFSRPEPLLFIQAAPQLPSRGSVVAVLDPLLLRKSSSAGNRARDLWVCSQEL
jgi:hypothetical protein